MSHLIHWNVHEQFFTLYDEMLEGLSIPEVLEQTSNVVRKAIGAQATTIYLIHNDTQELEANVIVDNVARTIKMPISPTSLAGYCAHSANPFLVPDAYGDLSPVSPSLSFDKSWDESHNFRTKDVMCVPALFKEEVVGVVQVINSQSEPFTEEDLIALQSVARLVGYALHSVSMYDDLASMKQLQKEKAKFMRVMVHELKSPVAASRMMAELLTTAAIPDEKKGDLLERIIKRLDGLMNMIKETLELSDVASQDKFGEVGPMDFEKVIIEISDQYSKQAIEKGLDYSLSTTSAPLMVRADDRGLLLIISNLISNAVKYTQFGAVSVSVIKNEGTAELRVADTGIGIPEEDVTKLFHEFFRASNAKTSKIEGTGIGLSAVKEMVERFKGTLHLETKCNEGSIFKVRLPLLKDQA